MIVVDSREPWEAVFDCLGAHPDVEPADYKLEALNGPEHPKTDYLVADGKLAVQRKEINDFVSSLGDLKDELFAMRKAHEFSMILVEGDWMVADGRVALDRGASVEKTVPVQTLHNFVVSQQLRGTVFVRTSALSETVQTVVAMDAFVRGPMRPPIEASDDPTMLLQLIPGIGPLLSGKLAAHYGSAYNALVNIGQWTEVDGVGIQTQETAVRWFKRDLKRGQPEELEA